MKHRWSRATNRVYDTTRTMSRVVHRPRLRDAYIELGRPDLARFVENGKKYQRLNLSVHGGQKVVSELNGIRQAFGQPSLSSDGTWPKTREEWNKAAELAYAADVGLQKLRKARRARNKAARLEREAM